MNIWVTTTMEILKDLQLLIFLRLLRNNQYVLNNDNNFQSCQYLIFKLFLSDLKR